VIVDVQVMGVFDPLTELDIGGKASGLPEYLLQRGQRGWRERHGFASRHVQRQQGVQASRFVEHEPMADGVAMDAQQVRHLLAGVGLPAGQQVEHLEPGSLAPVMFML